MEAEENGLTPDEEEEIMQMSVSQLKAEITAAGRSTAGFTEKSELQAVVKSIRQGAAAMHEDGCDEGGGFEESDDQEWDEEDDEGDGMTCMPCEGPGCSHYKRKCRLVAPCCGEVFPCRFCHDEVKNEGEKNPKKRHMIDRFAVEEVICVMCDERQPVAQDCRKCGIQMGAYFCGICRFYDDDTSKGAFHCDGCGICRVGGRENFFHCNKCNSCQPAATRASHSCFEGGMKQNCPVCMEYLFDSRRTAQSMRCGHFIHSDCYRDMLRSAGGMSSVRCPVCSMSVAELDSVWQSLDEEVAATPMPEEYADMMVTVLCNDCHKQGDVKFHIVGLKCSHCGGYNTRQIIAEGAAKAEDETGERVD